MTQKFTVALERINVYRAVVDVEADNIADARLKAIEKARGRRELWEADIGAPLVKKIIAHATPLKATP